MGKASTRGGDKIFCMEVFTAPASEFGADEENLLPLPEQDVQITGSNNSMNGHDNGVNVNVNVLGIQAIKNLASGSAQIDGNVNVSGIASIVNGTMSLDAESGLTEIAEIIKETVLV